MVAPAITTANPLWTESLQAELSFFTSAAKAPEVRTLRRFAEEEFIIPEGPRIGEHFYPDTQPFAGLLIDEIDSGRWHKFRVTGCVQSGKTLMLFVLPACYYLFEYGEPVICGLPTIQMAGDKWRKELLPAIEANPRFERQLMKTGKGSKGGSFEEMTFANSARLKFMGGQGGDATRSGYTARIFLGTEVDRYDVPSETSRETAPIFQMEKRTDAYAEAARCFGECTVTTEDGFIWQEYSNNSSSSKIMCPCPHCENWVCPEREHFVGHEDCESELEAEDRATFICPACAHIISDPQRRQMNQDAKLVHRGQAIDSQGRIEGDLPPTRTLGFRWNEFNNLFHSTSFIGGKEWEAAHKKDSHSADLERRQFTWVLPAKPDIFDETPLLEEDVIGRADELGRGLLPPGVEHISCGVDLRKTQLHFACVAWYRDELGQWRGHVCDYGTLPVESRKYGVRKAVRLAMNKLHKRLKPGYQGHPVGWRVVDSNYQGEPLRRFVREMELAKVKLYMPLLGRGVSVSYSQGGYKHPTKQSPQKPHIGEQYYVEWVSKYRMHRAIANVDHWKTVIHDALAMDFDQPGAVTIWEPSTIQEQQELRTFARHLISEKKKQKFVSGRGLTEFWDNVSRHANHYLDALGYAFVGGDLCGVKIDEIEPPVRAAVPAEASAPITPDGQPYLITDRS